MKNNLARELNHLRLRELNHPRGPIVLRPRIPGIPVQVRMPVDRSKWKLPELKAECRRRGIRLEGRKQEIIDRLESYDRNDDFQGPPIVLPPAPKFPAVNLSSFRTLTVSDKDILPNVSKEKC